MAEQLILAAIMIISLIFGTAAVLSRPTGTKMWAAAAYSGSFVYAATGFILPECGEKAFILVSALSLISLAVTGISYMFAITEVSGVLVPKPLKFFLGAVTVLYTVITATMHIHGMGITKVVIGTPDGSTPTTCTYGMLFYAATIVMIACIAFVGIFALVAMSKKLVKVSSGIRFLVILSLLLLIGASIGEFLTGSAVITQLIVLAADFLLLLMYKKLDRADILEFGKSCSVDSTNDGVIILDSKKKYLFANRTAKSVFMELSESDPEKLSSFVSTVTESESIKRGDRVFALKKTNYTDYRGSCDCIIVMIHDITEQELRTNRLNEEAAIDSITGLYNRTKLIEILTETCAEQSGTLLTVSFDGFKALNNLYGHEEANKILGTFGTLLKNNTNSDDIRGRLGGENFAVFMRNCTSQSVIANFTMRLEEQLTEALNKQLGNKTDVSVGISVGGVTVPENGRDYDKLSWIADAELKKIKQSGGHGYSICTGNEDNKPTDYELIELPQEFDPEKRSDSSDSSDSETDL